MIPISAVVITYNEEKNIRAALDSVRWADEIVVVDSHSTDRTVDICREYGAKILQRKWPGYTEQKRFATAQAAHEWVFSLDADERVSPALAEEIRQWRTRRTPTESGYRIPRKVFFLGRWIQHTSWYPDYQLRLFNRTRGGWQGGAVSESVKVQGPVGRFRGELRHYSFTDLSDWIARADRYATLSAEDYMAREKTASVWNLLGYPLLTFIKNFVIKRGFMDGVPGLIVSGLSALFVFLKYAKLWEARNVHEKEER